MNRTLILITGVMLLSSCATIFSGKKTEVVSSNPGAKTEIIYTNPFDFMMRKSTVESTDSVIRVFVSRYQPVYVTQYQKGFMPGDTVLYKPTVNYLLLTDLLMYISAAAITEIMDLPDEVYVAPMFAYFISQYFRPWVQNSQKSLTTGPMTPIAARNESMKYISSASVKFKPDADNIVYQYYKNGRKYFKGVKGKLKTNITYDASEETKYGAYLTVEQLKTLMEWGYYDSTGFIDPNPNNFVKINSELMSLEIDVVPDLGVKYNGRMKMELVSASNNQLLIRDTLHVHTRLMPGTSLSDFNKDLAEMMTYSLQDFFSDPAVKKQLVKDSSMISSLITDNSLLEIAKSDSMVVSLDDAKKAVVSITTKNGTANGCLISSDGYILSSSRIFANCTTANVTWSDGKKQVAEIIRENRQDGLSLLKVPPTSVKPFYVNTANLLTKGNDVMAVAANFNIDATNVISKGIISGIRTIRSMTWYQSDVPINQGSDGGAFVDSEFNLYGILQGQISGVEGFGFVIPVLSVEKSLNIKLNY